MRAVPWLGLYHSVNAVRDAEREDSLTTPLSQLILTPAMFRVASRVPAKAPQAAAVAAAVAAAGSNVDTANAEARHLEVPTRVHTDVGLSFSTTALLS